MMDGIRSSFFVPYVTVFIPNMATTTASVQYYRKREINARLHKINVAEQTKRAADQNPCLCLTRDPMAGISSGPCLLDGSPIESQTPHNESGTGCSMRSDVNQSTPLLTIVSYSRFARCRGRERAAASQRLSTTRLPWAVRWCSKQPHLVRSGPCVSLNSHH